MTEIMLWRRLDLPGHEIARLEAFDDGWKLFGTAILAYQHHPSKLDYVVICDAIWRTKSAKVKGVIDSREIDLTVTVDNAARNGSSMGAVSRSPRTAETFASS